MGHKRSTASNNATAGVPSPLGGGPGLVRSASRSNEYPEGKPWPDTGCHLFRACLSCPFPRCYLDYPKGSQSLLADLQDGIIVLMMAHDASIHAIAEAVGISWRTVYRRISVINTRGYLPPVVDGRSLDLLIAQLAGKPTRARR